MKELIAEAKELMTNTASEENDKLQDLFMKKCEDDFIDGGLVMIIAMCELNVEGKK